MNRFCALGLAFAAVAKVASAQTEPLTLEALGKELFFDTNLSLNHTQSCATCHDPDHGFADPRETEAGRAVSLGDDGVSLGDRNTPTASYAALAPEFYRNARGQYVGGFFLDGRAGSLEDQAAGPPLNPAEMGMPDISGVVARLGENERYVRAFADLFGEEIWQDPEATYGAMTRALAAFERTEFFAPFDSKYDRYLRGETSLTRQENRGRKLFFDPEKTNCSLCHQSQDTPDHPRETFTNYRYHNIGVPVNEAARAANGFGAGFVDKGLLGNPQVDHPAQAGRFKVPTLRNVAVTAPYMHNGVFGDLRTVVLFYLKYTSFDADRQKDPNTGETWALPEIKKTLAISELIKGEDLSEADIDALVAFMKALTDARYEALLSE